MLLLDAVQPLDEAIDDLRKDFGFSEDAMTYKVVLTENAKANLRHYYTRAAEHAPKTAARWIKPVSRSASNSSYPARKMPGRARKRCC